MKRSVNPIIGHWLAFSALFILSCASATAPVDSVPLVTVDSGSVAGAHFGSSAQEVMFLGIPYAAPPTGSRRWKPPSLHKLRVLFRACRLATQTEPPNPVQ